MKPTKERILDSYRDLLNSRGERAATLDSVAHAAGVSKGGLIYHFPSKEALTTGLCNRFDDLLDEDVRAMRTSPEGAAHYFVKSSVFTNSELDQHMTALTRLNEARQPRAQASLRRASEMWLQVLEEQIPDPAVARAVKLMGDGLYYQAIFADWEPEADSPTAEEKLLEVVDRLTEGWASGPAEDR